jgi:hypothetical protein
MITNEAYQKNEIWRFLNQKTTYFDTVKEFSDNLEEMDILTQLKWIENGSYGAGACLVLKRELEGLTKRMNHQYRIGSVLLHALYGKPFRYWNKLSEKAQSRTNEAVGIWLNRNNYDFAI